MIAWNVIGPEDLPQIPDIFLSIRQLLTIVILSEKPFPDQHLPTEDPDNILVYSQTNHLSEINIEVFYITGNAFLMKFCFQQADTYRREFGISKRHGYQ